MINHTILILHYFIHDIPLKYYQNLKIIYLYYKFTMHCVLVCAILVNIFLQMSLPKLNNISILLSAKCHNFIFVGHFHLSRHLVFIYFG